MDKQYNTQVCEAVKRDPIGFVDALLKEAETARNYTPILLEAASVIANFLLKNDGWQPPKPNSIENMTKNESS